MDRRTFLTVASLAAMLLPQIVLGDDGPAPWRRHGRAVRRRVGCRLGEELLRRQRRRVRRGNARRSRRPVGAARDLHEVRHRRRAVSQRRRGGRERETLHGAAVDEGRCAVAGLHRHPQVRRALHGLPETPRAGEERVAALHPRRRSQRHRSAMRQSSSCSPAPAPCWWTTSRCCRGSTRRWRRRRCRRRRATASSTAVSRPARKAGRRRTASSSTARRRTRAGTARGWAPWTCRASRCR